MFSTGNPLYFLFDVMKHVIGLLDNYQFFGISLFVWIIGFISMTFVISIFWKGHNFLSGSSLILRILSFFTRMPYVFPLFLMFLFSL